MGAFGERLRREREMRGISLADIAEATKIGTASLRALEEEQFHKLPGGIFNKGFVRAYAQYLGIDADQAVADYLAAVAETEQPAPEAFQAAAQPAAEAATDVAIPWRAVFVVVLIVALVAGSWYVRSRRQAQQQAQAQAEAAAPIPDQPATPVTPPPVAPQPDTTPTMPTDVSTQPAATPVSTAPAPEKRPEQPVIKDASAAPEPAPEVASRIKPASISDAAPIVLSIRAREASWMEITADGKTILSRILNASEQTSIRARNLVKLTVGNAGGIEISFNGKALPAIGADKQKRTLTFTPEGIQQ